jgi:hypothetical protein
MKPKSSIWRLETPASSPVWPVPVELGHGSFVQFRSPQASGSALNAPPNDAPPNLARYGDKPTRLSISVVFVQLGHNNSFTPLGRILIRPIFSSVTLPRKLFWHAVGTRWICRRPYRHGAADASRLARALSRSCRPTRERRERLPATEIHARHFQCVRSHEMPQNRSDASTQNARVPTAFSRPPVSLHRQIRQNTSTGTLIRNLASENAQKT